MSESFATSSSSTITDLKKDKPKQVRESNILAAKALGDAIRTSLGPKGMDKMIIGPNKDVTISNDGATILEQMFLVHPIAQMLAEASKAQDIEAGDGTTSVVVLAASLLDSASKLMEKGLHSTVISEGYQLACNKAIEILKSIAIKVDLTDREALIKSATTSLNSKVVSEYSNILAPISVDAVMSLVDKDSFSRENLNVDLKDIKVIHKLGGTIDDTELITNGIVLTQHFSNNPSKNLISLTSQKIESNVVVTDYTQMDRVLKEERQYILKICKAIQKSGCNILLLQKSILRDAITEIGLHFLTKMGIYVVKNIERDDIEYICRNLGCRAIASIDHFTSENLATVELVEEVLTSSEKYIKMTGIHGNSQTACIVVRGSNNLVIEEASRSLHDALCVVRSIVKSRHLLYGAGAPETEMSIKLMEYSQTLKGAESICVRSFSESLEVIPVTLAENAGLNAVSVMTELRKKHADGMHTTGINVNKGCVEDVTKLGVVQPLLVSTSALTLATESVRCILKIDDMIQAVR